MRIKTIFLCVVLLFIFNNLTAHGSSKINYSGRVLVTAEGFALSQLDEKIPEAKANN